MTHLRHLIALLCIALSATATQAQEEDMTHYITGASCNTLDGWSLISSSTALLQVDTWSSRGSKDGSGMTTPFIEYFTNSWNGNLPDNAVMNYVENLPAGRYRLNMLVRLYNEDTANRGIDLQGATLYVVTSLGEYTQPIDQSPQQLYNNQTFEVTNVSQEFVVGDDGEFTFALLVQDANFNWLAFKNVTLTLLERSGGGDDGGGDGGDGGGDGGSGDLPDADNPAEALKSGTYYLRNVETGRYLCAGGSWGTQAILGEHGLPVAVSKMGENLYTLDAGFNYEGKTFVGLSGTQLFCEMDQYVWTIAPSPKGYYNIITGDGNCIGYDGAMGLTPYSSDTERTACQWQFLTKQQMLEQLLSGKATDATFLIKNPRMDRNYSDTGWSEGAIGGDQTNQNMERWNTSFDSNQTLSNIPNGRYRLTVQGYYRYNLSTSNSNQYPYRYQVQQGYSRDLYARYLRAQLYANEKASYIRSIADEYNTTRNMGFGSSNYYLPNSQSQASQCFTAGLYGTNSYGDNEVTVNVTDHRLTIGVRNEQSGCDWTVWDNFELSLLELGDNSDYDPSTNIGNVSAASWDNPVDVSRVLDNPHPNVWKSYTRASENHLLTDIPNGHYRLRLHGYYCYGALDYQQEYSYDYGNQECVNNKVYAMYTIPYALLMERQGLYKPYAYLYGNGVRTGFPSIFAHAHDEATHSGDKETELGWVPDSQTGALQAFADGEYEMEALVPVTDGTLSYGVRKNAGYKNDRVAWDGYSLEYLGADRLTYASDIQITSNGLQDANGSGGASSVGNFTMTYGEKRQLSATVLPAEASDKRIRWSAVGSCVSIDSETGILTANGSGTATVYATAIGSEGAALSASVDVTVTYNTNAQSELLINEIQVANVDMFLDPSKNYGPYVELYNPTTLGIMTDGMKLSVDGGTTRYSIPSAVVPAGGYSLVWFDHNSALASQLDTKLDMAGGTVTLYGYNGAVVETRPYPAAVSRTSYARTVDGGSFWGITATPTPGRSNNTASYLDANNYTRLEEPAVSQSSCVFASPFTLKVDIPEGATLHYAIGGSTPRPTDASVSEDGLFDISQTTILRLLLTQEGRLPSPVRTLSYILRDKDYTLPVLSVVGNEDDFYNDTTGVFVPGISGRAGSGVDLPCNWNMDWERPVSFNYFSLDGRTDYSQEADLERCGGWSRSWYPYSFKLKGNEQYEGRNFIEQQIFSDKPYLKQKAWQVRNGGNDLLCRIKDASLQHLITSCGWHVDCQDYSPAHVFVNGMYTGMMNIREPNNKHFGYANYGLDLDEMDALELAGGYTVKTGSSAAFTTLLNLSSSAGNASTWQQICALLDVDEFANYMAAQVYLGGDDWPGNNCKAFKGNDGKFHIVFFDVDQALRYDAYAMTHVNNNSNCPLIRIFRNFMNYNATFRRQFIDAYCIAAGSVFEPERVTEQITAMAREMEHALALEGLEPWSTANNTIRVLASTSRQETMIRALSSLAFSGVGYYDAFPIRLQSNVDEACLTLGGQVIPTGMLDGFAFPGRTAKATSPMGYRFVGWQNSSGTIVSTDSEILLDGYAGQAMTAVFEEMTDKDRLTAFALPLKVNEVSAANTVQICEYGKKNDWIELYNNSDMPLDVAGLYVSDDLSQPLKYQIPESATTSTVVPAHGHIILWADKLEPVSQLHTSFKLGNDDGSWALITSSNEFVARNAAYFTQHPKLRNFADGLAYNSHRGDQSVGRYPDGGDAFYLMNRTSVERQNMLLTYDQLLGYDQGIMEHPGDFALDLAKGWNWVSLPLAGDVSVNSFDEKIQSIRGQRQAAYNDAVIGMTGTLAEMQPEAMYKVQATEAARYELGGEMADAASTRLTLNAGWNWLGYPIDGAQTLNSALADLPAEEGEMMVSQDGFAIFYDGAWSGTLTTLETGKGYMYRSANEKTFYYNAPSMAGARMRRDVQRRAAKAGRYDRYAYPNVMAVIAQLDIDGETPAAETFRVEAYSTAADGITEECRGVGQYVGDRLFLTLHGQGGEALHFRLTDEAGQTLACESSLSFASGAVGSMAEPFIISLHGDTDAIAQPDMAGGLTTTSVLYFNMAGQRLLRPTGICIERRTLSDGSTRIRKCAF